MTEPKPTFIRAAIEDWRNGLITNGRLFEILRVPFYSAYITLLNEGNRLDVDIHDISLEHIEEILMTETLLKEKALQDLKEV